MIERAGGLTDQAFPQGSVFLRRELLEREEEQIADLSSKIESDLASLQLQAANEDAGVQEAQIAGAALLAKLRNTRATGRLVIDLPVMLTNPDSKATEVLLKQGENKARVKKEIWICLIMTSPPLLTLWKPASSVKLAKGLPS